MSIGNDGEESKVTTSKLDSSRDEQPIADSVLNEPKGLGTKPQTSPMDFRINSTDNSGERIEKIYVQRPEYVIYRTVDAIYVEFDHGLPGIGSLYEKNGKLLRHVSKVTSYLPKDLGTCEGIATQVARAVAANIRGLEAEAIQILDEAQERVLRQRIILGRLQYTISSLSVVVLILIVRYAFFSMWSDSIISNSYLDILACGALGGFLSVATGFRAIEIDIDADCTTNCLVGGSRIFVAMVGSLFVYFAIKSGLALGIVNTSGNSYGLYSLAMASGFSERFVPSIMDNLVVRRLDENSKPIDTKYAK